MDTFIYDIFESDMEKEWEPLAKRFPVNFQEPSKWTNYTAEAIGLEISQDGKSLIVNSKNGIYEQWIYFSLLPPKDGPNDAYRKRIVTLIKTFDIGKKLGDGKMDIDPKKLDAAKGTIFAFGCKAATDPSGNQLYDKKNRPMANYAINGRADMLIPIGDALHVDNYDSDIPF